LAKKEALTHVKLWKMHKYNAKEQCQLEMTTYCMIFVDMKYPE
jgi:hypothetical protein